LQVWPKLQHTLAFAHTAKKQQLPLVHFPATLQVLPSLLSG